MRSWTVRVDEETAVRAGLLAELEGTSIQRLLLQLLNERLEQAANDPRMREHARVKVDAMRRAYGLDKEEGGTA